MKTFKHCTSIFVLLIILSSSAFSQESKLEREGEKHDSLKYEIQELTITGTRTVEKIIDIPYSVFRVDKKELAYGKKVSAKDVLADVPGLFLQSRYGNHDLRISIRGFGTRSNSGVRGVRILQDGIPESEPDGETVIDAIDLTSLGGVEVVKGNLSSLYANAPGGVINFVSDMFFPRDYAAIVQQGGQHGFRQTGVKMGLKNANNRLLFTYNYRNMDGYRIHSNENQHLINTVYEVYLGKSTISLLGNFLKGVIKLPGSLTRQEYQEDPFMSDPFAATLDYKRVTSKGRLGVRYKTSFGEEDNHEIELTTYGGIKELEKADNLLYSFATRYNLGACARYTKRGTLFGRKNTFTSGVEYVNQSGPVSAFDNVYGTRGISVQNEYTQSLSNIGVYFLNHFNLIEEKLDLFISGRFDRNIYSNNISIPYGLTDTTRIFQKGAPKAALNYKLTPNIALYTSYGYGFDFPALSELGNTPLSSNSKYSLNPDLDVQKSQNFELGIKGNIVNPGAAFMRKLFFEATFFDYKISDEIVPFIISQKTYFRNAAKTNRMGIEVGVKSHPFEGVEFVVNYTITKFKYDNYKTTIYTPGVPVTQDYSGNYVPSVPRNILNLILNYDFELTDALSVLLLWDCDYIGKMYVNDLNSDASSSYFYGNSMVGLNYNDNFIGAIFYVGINNIFDKRYSGFININDFNERYFETGEPRTIYTGLNFTYKL